MSGREKKSRKSPLDFFIPLVMLSSLGFLPGAARAQGEIVAVFDLNDRDHVLSAKESEEIVDELVIALTRAGYRVIPREQVRKRLLEQKIESYRNCYDDKCRIELGRELAAQKSLSPSLGRFGDECRLGAVLFDLKKAVSESAGSVIGECDVRSLVVACHKLAEQLLHPVPETAEGITPPSKKKSFQWTVGMGGSFWASPLSFGTPSVQPDSGNSDAFVKGFGGGGMLESWLYWGSFGLGGKVGFFYRKASPIEGSPPGESSGQFLATVLVAAAGNFSIGEYLWVRPGAGLGVSIWGGPIMKNYFDQHVSGGAPDHVDFFATNVFISLAVRLSSNIALVVREDAFFEPPMNDWEGPLGLITSLGLELTF